MNEIILPKEIQYEEINTPHGIFTSNTHLGLTAQEVYEKWLYDKENPKPVKLSLEEEVELLKEENKILNDRLNDYETMITSMYRTLTEKDIVTLDELPKSISKYISKK